MATDLVRAKKNQSMTIKSEKAVPSLERTWVCPSDALADTLTLFQIYPSWLYVYRAFNALVLFLAMPIL